VSDEDEPVVVGAKPVDFFEDGVEELVVGDVGEVARGSSVAGKEHNAYAEPLFRQAFGKLAEVVAASEVTVDEEDGALGVFGPEVAWRGADEESCGVTGLAGIGTGDEAVACGIRCADSCQKSGCG
jgi:hypothetical protein